MRKTTIVITLLLLAATSLSAQATDDSRLVQMINAALGPEVGDREVMQRLLNPRIARPQFGESFDPKTVDKTVGESLQPDKACPPFKKATSRCDYRSQDGSFMRVDLVRGQVGYVNPKRSSNLMVNTTLTAARAMSLAAAGFAALGIPAEEISRTPRAAKLMVGARNADDHRSSFSSEPEWHVGVKRHIGGVTVLGSQALAVIDAQGSFSRLYATWPTFAIEPGYTADETISRSAVIASIVERLAGDVNGDSIARLKASIKYARVDRVDGADRSDEVAPDVADRSTLFVPALEVTVFPIEQEEDSGITQEAGEQFLIGLLGAPRVGLE